MSKIVVGMSGGVDSAVCAYLLKLAGHEVIGVTLRTWISADGKESRCCEIDDARRVAWQIGMSYHVVNCIAEFKEKITDPFIEDYLQGITPNPCVLCNQFVKWEKLLEVANLMGADGIATGHYATIRKLPSGRYTVQKALHAAKDQTYMLYRLSQEQLARTMMPLGKLRKEEVRAIAASANLSVATKSDSQEICFVTDGDYADYIENYATGPIPDAGDFVDEEGRILGKHRGIIHYTVGQRKGLGLALGYPAYVKDIRSATNQVVIAPREKVYHREIICHRLNFMGIDTPWMGEEIPCFVKVRYHHEGTKARVTYVAEDVVKITFAEPVWAASPGQSAVFYDEAGCVLGGGIIRDVIS